MVPLPPSDDFEERPAVSREGSLAVSVFFPLGFDFVWSSESTAVLTDRAALQEKVLRVIAGASADDGATSTCTESVP